MTPPISNLFEEARPGRVYHCKNPKIRAFLSSGGQLLTWQPRPVIAKRLYWRAGGSSGALGEGGVSTAKQAPLDNNLAPGETASQQINLPPGRWELSLQYVSPVTGVTVRAPRLSVHLPSGMDAAIPYRPDQGPYWPVGPLNTAGGKITVSVQADDVRTYQQLLGVDAPAVIGNLTAVNRTGFRKVPTAAACGLYVDHVIGGVVPSRPGQKDSSSGNRKSSGK
jgi:hypothetical protein